MSAVTVLAGAIIVGCGESEISKVESDEQDAVNTSTNEVEAAEVDEEVIDEADEVVVDEAKEETTEVAELDLGIGDTVAFDGLEVTLNSVHTTIGQEFFEPDNVTMSYLM